MVTGMTLLVGELVGDVFEDGGVVVVEAGVVAVERVVEVADSVGLESVFEDSVVEEAEWLVVEDLVDDEVDDDSRNAPPLEVGFGLELVELGVGLTEELEPEFDGDELPPPLQPPLVLMLCHVPLISP